MEIYGQLMPDGERYKAHVICDGMVINVLHGADKDKLIKEVENEIERMKKIYDEM